MLLLKFDDDKLLVGDGRNDEKNGIDDEDDTKNQGSILLKSANIEPEKESEGEKQCSKDQHDDIGRHESLVHESGERIKKIESTKDDHQKGDELEITSEESKRRNRKKSKAQGKKDGSAISVASDEALLDDDTGDDEAGSGSKKRNRDEPAKQRISADTDT